jgi:uncharacterized integral membrane protein
MAAFGSTGGDGSSAARDAATLLEQEPSAFRRLLGYIAFVVKLVLVLALVALAVMNGGPVTLRFFLGHEVQTSLAVALVAAASMGTLLGALVLGMYAFRQSWRARRLATALQAMRLEVERAQGDLAGARLELASRPALPPVTSEVSPIPALPQTAPTAGPAHGL